MDFIQKTTKREFQIFEDLFVDIENALEKAKKKFNIWLVSECLKESVLSIPIDDLNLGTRAENIIKYSITTKSWDEIKVADIVSIPRNKILHTRNSGKGTLKIIEECLMKIDKRLHLDMTYDEILNFLKNV